MSTTHGKKVDWITVAEIGLGFMGAILVIRLLGMIFGKIAHDLFSLENLDNMENFHGKGKARRRGRRHKRAVKKQAELDAIRDKYDDEANQEAENARYEPVDGSDDDGNDDDDQ